MLKSRLFHMRGAMVENARSPQSFGRGNMKFLHIHSSNDCVMVYRYYFYQVSAINYKS